MGQGEGMMVMGPGRSTNSSRHGLRMLAYWMVHTLNGTCSGHSSNCSRCSQSAELSLLPLSYRETERALPRGWGSTFDSMCAEL